MEKKLQEIASHFALEGGIAAIDSLGEGFINDTFIIRTEGEAPDYILQRKNKNIFPDVPAMMDNIRRVTDHIRRGVIAAGGDPRREVMTVVPTREDALYHIDGDGEYWAVSVFIDDTVAYNKADSPGTGPQRRRRNRQIPSPAGRLHRAAGRNDQGIPQHPPPLHAVGRSAEARRRRPQKGALRRRSAGSNRGAERCSASGQGRGGHDSDARDAQRHQDKQYPVRQAGRGALRHRPSTR